VGRSLLDVSVVVPLYNGEKTIDAQLNALSAQTFSGSWEAIIADNGSTDAGPEIVQQWEKKDPRIRLVHAPRPGSPAARNQGASESSGRLLAFCDDDDLVEPQWLASYVAAATSRSQLTGPVDLRTLGTKEVWRARNSPTAQPMAADHPFGIGANNAIDRELFFDLGGYCEDVELRAGYDVDFSWRLLEAGYDIVFVPDAVVVKRPKPGIWGHSLQWFEYGRSSVELYRRHPNFDPRARDHNEQRRRRQRFKVELASALRRPWAARAVLAQMGAYQVGHIVGPPKRSASARHYR
jgi:glycosyltransferase involved in cell wall biosynthesis